MNNKNKHFTRSFKIARLIGFASLCLNFFFFNTCWGNSELDLLYNTSPGAVDRGFGSSPPKALSNQYNFRSENTIRVHIFGSVVSPGTYTLEPIDRLVSLISLSGGIKQTGSERKVELRRGKTTKLIDLLELKRNGLLKNNPFLQDDDVIFVPQKQATVAIQGPIHEPGLYEIETNTTLKNLIDLSLGFTSGLSDLTPIKVLRYDAANKQRVELIENNPTATESFVLKDGDIIQVPHKFMLKNSFDQSVAQLPNDSTYYPSYMQDVYIVGGVRMPGKFKFSPQLRISSYVAMAGGKSRLGRNDALLQRLGGQSQKANLDSDIRLNPGDTLIVGEDKLGPEFWITFMTTLASLGVSTYAILR